jgi:hypothetical protein
LEVEVGVAMIYVVVFACLFVFWLGGFCWEFQNTPNRKGTWRARARKKKKKKKKNASSWLLHGMRLTLLPIPAGADSRPLAFKVLPGMAWTRAERARNGL